MDSMDAYTDANGGELGIGTVVHGDFDEVVERARTAIAEGGFGVMTEIDVTATLRNKLGREIERLHILGACNPAFAAEALDASRDVSLMMPCNVVVREDPELGADAVRVVAMNPALMGRMAGVSGLADLMGRAETAMRGIIGSLE